MRILKIAGQNIASLAEPFLIDLTAEPLRSAGLFAITGQTGAGKSSILDAMCLALYGDAPRLSSGSRQDEVPDAGGEAIKAQDPRAILRRGANQAWAAVTFTGIDGQEYEAKWTVRRARDRAEGRLQGVARQIARVSDGQVLASQLTHVSDQVQALTGLSYDEFRRTVLLAQGDFDAFLRAETNERAALLEKVTGTGLYRAISTSVFDRTAEAQAALTLLIQQRDAHHLLPPEALQALQTEREVLEAAVLAGRAERLVLEADLSRHRHRAEAETRLQAADLALTAARAQAAAAQTQRDQLALIDRSEPLRLPYEALQTAQAAKSRAAVALAQATQILQDAGDRRAIQQSTAETATARHEETEALFKTLGPLWTEATQLDSRIKDATTEAAQASTQAADATQRALRSETLLNDLHHRIQTLRETLTEAEAALSDLAPVAGLAAAWDSLSRDLTEREAACQAEAKAVLAIAGLGVMTRETEDMLGDLDQADALDQLARQTQTTEAARLIAAIAEGEARKPQDRLDSLTQLSTALSDLDRLWQDHAAAAQAVAVATGQRTRAEAEAEAAQTAITTAETTLTRSEGAAAALTAPTEQAQLAVSQAARTLRLHLQPGHPCPVCGSTEHPSHEDSALATLAAQLRADLTRVQAEGQAARTALTKAQGDLAGARARVQQAGQMLDQQSGLAAMAETAWMANLSIARALPLCPDLPDLPTSLRAERGAVEQQRLATLAALSDIATLRARKDQADTARQTLATAMELRAATRRDLTGALADLRQEAALQGQSRAAAEARRVALDLGLHPLLEAVGEAKEALDLDPTALRQRLLGRVQAYQTALATRQGLQTALTGLQPELAGAEAAHQEAKARTLALAEAARQRAFTLSALQTDRADLLGGEPTEAHRTRHNLTRLANQSGKDQAISALAEAEASLGQAMGGHTGASGHLAEAEAALAAARVAMAAGLAGSDMTLDALTGLFARPRREVEDLRQALRKLDDAVTAALSTRQARETDLAGFLAEGQPDLSAEDLTDAVADLDAAQSLRAERMGAVAAELAADQATRAQLVGLQDQIAVAGATAEVWAAVNAAVGSRNGDAFARIAQSITLDQLVDHANHHLADLKPRYRLQRAGLGGAGGLALQVLDLDMGAEARATRSLSGGERFLVSLALALALSRMGDRGGLAATLFIDEGFGSLDAETLDVAIDALETLQAQGRTIGVISHVEAMKDRIPVQIRVERQGGGRSRVHVTGPGG